MRMIVPAIVVAAIYLGGTNCVVMAELSIDPGTDFCRMHVGPEDIKKPLGWTQHFLVDESFDGHLPWHTLSERTVIEAWNWMLDYCKRHPNKVLYDAGRAYISAHPLAR